MSNIGSSLFLQSYCYNHHWRCIIQNTQLQGGPKKVSLIIFAITLSTASQYGMCTL